MALLHELYVVVGRGLAEDIYLSVLHRGLHWGHNPDTALWLSWDSAVDMAKVASDEFAEIHPTVKWGVSELDPLYK